MAHDVFVSYASGDKTVADAVCAMLESQGVRCWIAPRDVEPGMAYGEAILEGIQGCRIMVLVFSARANASTHIPKEIERAVSKGASVIPLRIEDVTPGKSLDYFIGNVHWLDALTPPLENHLRRLAKNVQTILSRDETVSEETGAFIAAQAASWGASGGTAGVSRARAGGEVAPSEKQKPRPAILNVLVGTLSILVIVFALLYFLRKPPENPTQAPAAAANNIAPSSSPRPHSASSSTSRQKTPAAPQSSSSPQPSPSAQSPSTTQAPATASSAGTTTPAAAKAPSAVTTLSAVTTPSSKDDAKSSDLNDSNMPEMHKAQELLDKGDYGGAIAKYREIIRQHPNNAMAHSNLSGALRMNGNLDEAVAEANEALRIKPHLPVAHTALGLALARKNDWDGAINEYHEALRLNPDLPNAHCLLGIALARKGDWNRAIAEYREALRLKPDLAEAHYSLGKALAAKGDQQGATREYTEAHRLDPKYSQP